MIVTLGRLRISLSDFPTLARARIPALFFLNLDRIGAKRNLVDLVDGFGVPTSPSALDVLLAPYPSSSRWDPG